VPKSRSGGGGKTAKAPTTKTLTKVVHAAEAEALLTMIGIRAEELMTAAVMTVEGEGLIRGLDAEGVMIGVMADVAPRCMVIFVMGAAISAAIRIPWLPL
jgi:hypothetical protein